MTAKGFQPLPPNAQDAVRGVPGVVRRRWASTWTAIQVNGKPVNQMTDTIDGVEARLLPEVYRPEWLARRLRRADRAAARRHRAGRGAVRQDPRHRGRRALPDRDALGRQGDAARRSASTATRRSSRASSSTCRPSSACPRCNDPFAFFVKADPGADRGQGAAAQIAAALDRFPTAEVRSDAAVPRAHQRAGQPDRLPALRAAGDEPRDLAVRDRQQPLPRRPRAHARVRAAARGRRHAAPGPAHRPLRERDHRRHRRAARHRGRRLLRRAGHRGARATSASGSRCRSASSPCSSSSPSSWGSSAPPCRRAAPPASTCSTRCATTEGGAMSTTTAHPLPGRSAPPWGPGRVARPDRRLAGSP